MKVIKMAKNHNIQTIVKELPAGGLATAIGSSVPANMTRFVTFVRVDRSAPAINTAVGSKLYLCEALSNAKTSYSTPTLASALQKMVVIIPSAVTANKDFQSTPKIDTENPLFSIAASKFLTTLLVSDANLSGAANMFVQYYDE